MRADSLCFNGDISVGSLRADSLCDESKKSALECAGDSVRMSAPVRVDSPSRSESRTVQVSEGEHASELEVIESVIIEFLPQKTSRVQLL